MYIYMYMYIHVSVYMHYHNLGNIASYCTRVLVLPSPSAQAIPYTLVQ